MFVLCILFLDNHIRGGIKLRLNNSIKKAIIILRVLISTLCKIVTTHSAHTTDKKQCQTHLQHGVISGIYIGQVRYCPDPMHHKELLGTGGGMDLEGRLKTEIRPGTTIHAYST
jgi:hypothetical protein